MKKLAVFMRNTSVFYVNLFLGGINAKIKKRKIKTKTGNQKMNFVATQVIIIKSTTLKQKEIQNNLGYPRL